ncbi:MAG: enoyl-CoA hydratase/isomerase family protein [Acidobacteriota bacterium]|nr:enoyl-CoA hydratase/isomerase family protein [Blastocatellia bacterium]MDW8238871.1 enoyl-CoA hydratase/isomerase family protein [Acidobacteriota bacterium]
MMNFNGETLSWELTDGVVELALHRPPCNEIGSATLRELEQFVEALASMSDQADALIIYSRLPAGFCAGADLRELYHRSYELTEDERLAGVRDFLERIHRVMNAIDTSPLVTIAAVHGVVFGGGFELALTCDMIIAEKMARFCFPELRLGLIPGFGGIPRLKRDLGNAVVRDLLLTGRSFNATKAQTIGLVSQMANDGQALSLARSTAAQIKKFDRATRIRAKQFIKPVPYDQLREEIEIFCELLTKPAVEAGLRKFVESTDAQPYLP